MLMETEDKVKEGEELECQYIFWMDAIQDKARQQVKREKLRELEGGEIPFYFSWVQP